MSKTTREQYEEAYRLVRINAQKPSKRTVIWPKLAKFDDRTVDAAYEAHYGHRHSRSEWDYVRRYRFCVPSLSVTGRDFFKRTR